MKTEKQKQKDRADKLCSLFIRLKYSDWRGYVSCYTCDKIDHYKNMQCGHFISRSCHKLRFDERNLRCQCRACNVFKSGNYIEYTLRLIKEKGKAFVEKLRKESKEIVKYTAEDYKKIGDKFQAKLNKLDNYEK